MDDLVYAGFVAAGAITLLIEAFRNFNSPGNAHPFTLHPVLKSVEIRNLTTPAEALVGFAIYAAFYLIVYAVVLSSAEIMQLVLESSSTSDQVGAIGTALQPDGEAFSLNGRGYEKPLLVSAALIAFLSLGVVKPIEATLRRIAHSVAGIPDGIYKVVTALQNHFDGKSLPPGSRHVTPLAARFEKNADLIVSKEDGMTDLRGEIGRALAAIDCLTEATHPDRSRLYFPLFQLATLKELTTELQAEITALDAAIQDMPNRKLNNEAPAEIMASIRQMAATARQNAMAVFAVLYVRNNRSVFISGRPIRPSARGSVSARNVYEPPIEKVRQAIEQRYNAELNSFMIAFIFSCALGAFATYWIYMSWLERNAYSENPRSDLIWIVCGDGKPQYATINLKASQQFNDPPRSSDAQTHMIDCSQIPNAAGKKHQGFATQEHVKDFLLKLRPEVTKLMFFDILRSAALVFGCVYFALIGRESRIEDQSWKISWELKKIPFLTLLGMSFFPGLIAVVVAAGTRLLEEGFHTGWALSSTQAADLFSGEWPFFALHFGSGLLLAFGALVIMDKHADPKWHWYVTLPVALGFIALLAVWFWIILYFTAGSYAAYYEVQPGQGFSQHLRDTAILTMVPGLFFLFFGILLEFFEPARPALNRKVHVPPDNPSGGQNMGAA